MTLEDIRRLADALGIEGARTLSVGELIHLIRLEEGRVPCYSEAWSAPCGVDRCPFADVCSSNLHIESATRH